MRVNGLQKVIASIEKLIDILSGRLQAAIIFLLMVMLLVEVLTRYVLRSPLSIAEEMGVVLGRSSFSPNIKERRDFSAAMFDASGRLVAQARRSLEATPTGAATLPAPAPAAPLLPVFRRMRTSSRVAGPGSGGLVQVRVDWAFSPSEALKAVMRWASWPRHLPPSPTTVCRST